MKKEDRALFRDYIIEICEYYSLTPPLQAEPNLSQSIVFFKNLISLGKFCELIQGYIIQTYEILIRLKNEKRIGRLLPHKRNELIEGYDEFMKNIVALLGEPFLLNIIWSILLH